ncbi:hypothetical protein E2C01_031711 [Portunus trituberculatus]|uniref:Uncharacterized protein n=1 Tax=Portunus trituberculatus TaxID=210409 RepID=A0A5B7EYE5_PORTR|nr:hypothetical protein [Portunus trituberculatus]
MRDYDDEIIFFLSIIKGSSDESCNAVTSVHPHRGRGYKCRVQCSSMHRELASWGGNGILPSPEQAPKLCRISPS